MSFSAFPIFLYLGVADRRAKWTKIYTKIKGIYTKQKLKDIKYPWTRNGRNGLKRSPWAMSVHGEVAHIYSFYPKGSKLRLFLLYMQRFPRYWPFFKTDTFEHETWPFAKLPEVVAHVLSFYARGEVKFGWFSLYGQLPRYGPIFNIAIFGHETGPLTKFPGVAHTTKQPYNTKREKGTPYRDH